jgi:hypothetical protein
MLFVWPKTIVFGQAEASVKMVEKQGLKRERTRRRSVSFGLETLPQPPETPCTQTPGWSVAY